MLSQTQRRSSGLEGRVQPNDSGGRSGVDRHEGSGKKGDAGGTFNAWDAKIWKFLSAPQARLWNNRGKSGKKRGRGGKIEVGVAGFVDKGKGKWVWMGD